VDTSDFGFVLGALAVDDTDVTGAVTLGVVDPSDSDFVTGFGDEEDDISSFVVLSSTEVVDFSVFAVVLGEGVVCSSVMVVKAVLSAIETDPTGGAVVTSVMRALGDGSV